MIDQFLTGRLFDLSDDELLQMTGTETDTNTLRMIVQELYIRLQYWQSPQQKDTVDADYPHTNYFGP